MEALLLRGVELPDRDAGSARHRAGVVVGLVDVLELPRVGRAGARAADVGSDQVFLDPPADELELFLLELVELFEQLLVLAGILDLLGVFLVEPGHALLQLGQQRELAIVDEVLHALTRTAAAANAGDLHSALWNFWNLQFDLGDDRVQRVELCLESCQQRAALLGVDLDELALRVEVGSLSLQLDLPELKLHR